MADKIICPYCDYSHEHQGAINLHIKRKHGKEIEDKPCDCEDSGKWRLLVQSGVELTAIKAGYKEVCLVCKELR